ncbi:MAG: glycosyltransferase family 39 protein [Clostridia bacterium]|nr:glycosyltransferase family 39 protein [Clostridia bacterium]
MKKKWISLAAVWLALAALVFVYTDRQAYTWRYDGEDTAQIVISEQAAQEREALAGAKMDAEREAAKARTAQGLWGKEDLYDGAPETLSAQGEDGGLNLMWGEYEAVLTYQSPEAFSLCAVSALRQSFIEGESVSAPAGEGSVALRFSLTDAAQGVYLACDLPEGAQVDSATVRKLGGGVFSRDLAAYAALAGVVLSVLLALSWDTSAEGEQRRRDALILVMTAVFASMPCLWNGLREGHDLFFHLNRIEGIASALRAGQFPVRIHASTLLGYGYAASEFYPELFLYFPAVLRNLGVSLTVCVLVFQMTINFATAAVCYGSARRLFGSRRVALGASVLYTLCVYRLVNLYVRATLGESLAMIFFPLLIWAMVEVLTRDERRWPLLALAMTGIFMSHLLSTMFAVLFCAAASALCLPRLIRERRRILAILKAAGLMILCSLWFLVPFASYARSGISTSVALDASKSVLTLGSYLVGFSGNMANLPESLEDFACTIGVVPGLAMLMGCALLLVRLYARGRGAKLREGEARSDRLSLALLAFGTVALLGATEFFPWAWACALRRPISTFFRQIQFPWRLVGVAAPMLAMAAAWGYLKEERHAAAGMAAIVSLSVVFGGYTMQSFVQQEVFLTAEDYCDTRIGQFEYTYPGTEKSALEPGYVGDRDGREYTVRSIEKRGTTLELVLDMSEGGLYIEVPLLYYPGYRATRDGAPCSVVRGENNVVRVYGAGESESAVIRVWFEEPPLWRAAEAASLAGAALLLFALARMGGGRVRRRRGA